MYGLVGVMCMVEVEYELVVVIGVVLVWLLLEVVYW